MIAADNFYVFRRAASNGHLNVLRYLEIKAPNKVQEMIRADNFRAFQFAIQDRHLEVVNHLLSFASVFAFAEAHQQEYGPHITAHLNQQLINLHARKQALNKHT